MCATTHSFIVASKKAELGKSSIDPPTMSQLDMAPGTTQAPKSTSTTFKANKLPGSSCFKWHALTALPGMFIMGELHSQGDPSLAPQSVQTCFFFSAACLPEPSNAIILSGQLTSPDQRTKTLLALTTFPTIQRSLWILQTRTHFWLILLSVDGGRVGCVHSSLSHNWKQL